MTEKPPNTTTDAGIPAASDEHSLTVGPNGPILLQDHYVIQKMAQFNRERVPERVVHAKGGAAHGFFEVTADVTQYCKADFLSQVGKRTPVFLRFSTVAGELGSADTVWGVEGAEMVRLAYTLRSQDDDFGQPGTLWRNVLSETDRDHLVSNIVGHATTKVSPEIQRRVVQYWTNVDTDLGARVAAGLRGDSSNGRAADAPVGTGVSTGL
jgi:catalase